MVVHPQATEAINGIKSPYCPGQMLQTCPSPGAAVMRDSIQLMAEEGLSSDSIIEVMLASYGEEWRAEPKAAGTGMWAWILPPAGILGGLTMVALLLTRRRREEEAVAVAAVTGSVSEADEARLREALHELEEEEEPAF